MGMHVLPTLSRRVGCLVFASLPLVLMAPGPERGTTSPPAARAVGVLREVELIPPGTVIGKSAPKGWTHLILKSQPRLPADQKRLVSEMTARLATLVFTATTASVEAYGTGSERRYRLARLGVGVGVNINGKDVIVSPQTQAKLGANLGLLARQVLAGVYDKQKTIRLVAVGPTLAIMDTPAFMARGKVHAPVVLRYVFLVDPLTGSLDTLVWRIDTDGRGGYEGTVGMIEWLAPNTLVDATMQVDLDEFRLGIPSERAFAITSIPPGQRQFNIPDGLRTIAGTAKLTAEQAGKLQQGLREMLKTARTTSSR